MRALRWRRVPPELAAEARRLRREGRSEREIIAATGLAKGSVWRALDPNRPVVPVVWKPRAGRVCLEDRIAIAVGLAQGDTFTAIARRIGKDVSCVSREVGGRAGRVSYNAEHAHHRAERNTRRPKPTKLEASPRLTALVIADLERWWSPQQISARLREQFPAEPEMWVSHETIYKSLFVQGRGALRKELAACLRTGRASRQRRRPTSKHGAISGVPISERPAEVEDRAVPGHWEGDLIFGGNTVHAIGTLVERSTRFVMLLHLPDGHSAEQVRSAIASKIQTLPATLFQTLTWDRGSEMARHDQLKVDTGVEVFFCDPYKPWQRGSNENTNGLLRQYFPKGSDFSKLTRADLDAAADSLNGRPRQTLNWLTPTEALQAVLANTA